MENSFFINNVFEENLEFGWNITNGTFTTSGQTYVFQHLLAVQNINSLLTFSHEVENTDEYNFFKIDFRWSLDNITFTSYISIDNIDNFPNPNTDKNIWIQVKYTFVSNGLKDSILKEINFTGTRLIDPIFQPVTITPGNSVTFTNQDTYKVFKLEGFQVFLSTGELTDLEMFYRYTQTQGRHWTEWTPLTDDNLKVSKFERLKFCNFQFGFKNIGTSNIGVYDLELIGEFQNITANYATSARLGFKTQCNPITSPTPCPPDDSCCTSCIPCSEALTPWNSTLGDCDECSVTSVVNINDRKLFQGQINTYNTLTNYINAKNSWKVKYFLTDPDKKGIDHVLHEQSIHNIIAMKDVNVIIPDNQFPVENMSFSGLDLDLIQSFEIHILKESFKQIFGVEFRPSKEDVLFICDVNQLWEVEQMFPNRGFMNTEVYYRVMMKKYNDKASRKFAKTTDGQDAKNFIDEITKYTTLNDLFGIEVDEDIKQNTKDNAVLVQDPSQQYTDSPLLTLVRNAHERIMYNNEEIWNASLIVSKQNYKMPIKSKNLRLVEYNTTDNILGKADNRAISFWFKTEEYDPSYDWTILHNYDETNLLGYKVNIFDGLLTITINSENYHLPMATLSSNKWYSFLINIDQIRQKLELAIYNRQVENNTPLPASNSSQLVLFAKKEYDITPQSYTIDETIFIGGSDTFINTGNTKSWYITNLVIWNQPIAKAKRNIVLNESVISDAHLTLLVDDMVNPLMKENWGNI